MSCNNCARLERENRKLRERLREYEAWLDYRREQHRQYMRRWRAGRGR